MASLPPTREAEVGAPQSSTAGDSSSFYVLDGHENPSSSPVPGKKNDIGYFVKKLKNQGTAFYIFLIACIFPFSVLPLTLFDGCVQQGRDRG